MLIFIVAAAAKSSSLSLFSFFDLPNLLVLFSFSPQIHVFPSQTILFLGVVSVLAPASVSLLDYGPYQMLSQKAVEQCFLYLHWRHQQQVVTTITLSYLR